ncbi:MAG: hypothetical protein ACYC2G_06550 [Gemmatimonadaceae bacterium]
MPNDQPTPRPPLPPPFSRPTHPGYLPAIHPDSEAGRPLRPTPYANAAIPAYPTDRQQAASEADVSSPAGSVGEQAGDRGRPEATAAAAERVIGVAGDAGDTNDAVDGSPSVAVAGADATEADRFAAGQGAVAGGGVRSLRDLHVDHGRPTGVPANPEPAVEAVDSVSDYPTETVWSSDAVFGWGASAADWELVNASTVQTPSHPPDAPPGPPTVPDTGPSDLALGAADLLERLARAITRGDVVLPSVVWPQTAPAVLAAVLTALLARSDGDQWEAREASASERRR